MDDRNLALEVVRVTELAAIAAAREMGRGDRFECDGAATDAMRDAFERIDIRGTVVIGEGERDGAPMLCIGEKVGAGWKTRDERSPVVDIAVDPLEGTKLCATGAPDALSVIALADDGQFLSAPETNMDKIAVGPEARGAIDLRESVTWNLKKIAEAKQVEVRDLTAIILDRPRHEEIIGEIRDAGARIRLIAEGDVAAAVTTCKEGGGVDVLFGTGGAPEGVITAAALSCAGGDMQARLRFRSKEERVRARLMGITDEDRIYTLDELASGDVMFAATGVTGGYFLDGVRFFSSGAKTQSVVMRSRSGTIRYVNATHRLDRKLKR